MSRGMPDFYQFKNYTKMKMSLKGTRVSFFSAWGYASRKRLGTAGLNDEGENAKRGILRKSFVVLNILKV